METINELLMALAGSAWVYPAIAIVCLIDGFFPPMPSEAVVVGFGAMALSSGQVNVVGLIAAAAIGAMLGDSTAYLLGRVIGTDRFAWMRRPRIARALDWARGGIENRAASLIFVARYIPIGRVAVNMTAGAVRLPYRRFVLIDAGAAITWALYSVVIGVAVGALVPNPIVAAIIAVVVAALMGMGVDALVRVARRRTHARAAAQPALEPASEQAAVPTPVDNFSGA